VLPLMAPKAKRNPSNPPKAAAKAGTAAAPPPKAKAAAAPGAKARGASAGPAKAAPPAAKAAAAAAAAEERRKAEEEAKAAAARAAEEAVAKAAEEAAAQAEAERKQKEVSEAELKRLAALANGEVTIKYNMYGEKFSIKNHTLTAQAIDELYCLSDVMPGCFIHLSEKEFAHGEDHAYVREEPAGTFLGLMAGGTYWCYVQQDPEQEKKDQEAMKQCWSGQVVGGGVGDRGSEGETCSCGWGAPCTNAMICKDWDNRFANAIKAGGNPILFTNT